MSEHFHLWASLCLALPALACLALFGRGYTRLHSRQSCQMTYSMPRYKAIETWVHSPYELLQYENGQPFDIHADSHPVLFIPGSLGSYEQVRSLGSHVAAAAASNQSLQLFVVDLLGSPSAVHAAYIIEQAAFVNEALSSIRRLYVDPSVQIRIIAHSYGGVVARVAPLLSNHPSNSVDLIVMLSSPNMAPPFYPDASFKSLYNTMDRWWRPRANTSMCEFSQGSSFPSVTLKGCANVSDIALLSLSGGDQDLLVHQFLTPVLTKWPHNTLSTNTHEAFGYGVDHKAMVWCFDVCHAVISAMQEWVTVGNASLHDVWAKHLNFNMQNLTANASIGEHQTATSVDNNTTGVNTSASYVDNLTPLRVQARYLSTQRARRDQRILDTLGVFEATSYIAAVDAAPLIFTGIVTLSASILARYVLGDMLGVTVAHTPEVSAVIPGPLVVMQSWCILPLLLNVCFSLFPPPVETFLRLRTAPMMRVLFEDQLLQSRRINKSLSQGVWVNWMKNIFTSLTSNLSVVAAGIATLSAVSGGLVYVSILEVDGLAFLLPMVWCGLVYGVSAAVVVLTGLVCVCARASILTSYTALRFTIGQFLPPPGTRGVENLILNNDWLLAVLSLSLVGYAIIRSYAVQEVSSFRSLPLMYATAVLIYALYRTLILQCAWLVLFPSLGTLKDGYHLVLAVLYLPAVILAYPSASFADRLLFSTFPPISALGHFTPDLIGYVFCVTSIVLHLLLATRKAIQVPPVAWLSQMYRSNLTALTLYDGLTSACYNTDTQKACLHPEGGPMAVYEQTTINKVILAPGIYLGPMFRVVWCNCAARSELNYSQYCEWCRCSLCGGRNLLQQSAYQHTWDLPFEVYPAVALVIITMIAPLYVGDHVYRNLHVLGAIAFVCTLQHLCH